VPVDDPFDDSVDARRSAFVHHLHRGGLVASTTRIRAWTRGGRPMHHIVDPATGVPSASGVTAAVVTAAHAWWAEGIAKAIVVVGVERGLALAHRAGVHAWCFTDTRDVVEVDGTGAAAA
jgi:thiamine biosynthesis lipoprotein